MLISSLKELDHFTTLLLLPFSQAEKFVRCDEFSICNDYIEGVGPQIDPHIHYVPLGLAHFQVATRASLQSFEMSLFLCFLESAS